jgi:heme O synthase-like polyprenyltransferase
MRYSSRLKILVVSSNAIILIVLGYFWAILTQESQLLAAVLVSGNIIGSVELYSFLLKGMKRILLNLT